MRRKPEYNVGDSVAVIKGDCKGKIGVIDQLKSVVVEGETVITDAFVVGLTEPAWSIWMPINRILVVELPPVRAD